MTSTPGTYSGTDLSDTAASPWGDNHVENLIQDLDDTFIFQKYISGEFVGNKVADHYEISHVLKKLRLLG